MNHSVNRPIVGPLKTICYIIQPDGEEAAIDPDGSRERVLDILEKNIRVKYIINTPGHDDHTEAIQTIKAATGAALLVPECNNKFFKQ